MVKRDTLNVEVNGNFPEFEVDWDGPHDKSLPFNWPLWYKTMVVGFASFSTWVVGFYSSLYTSSIPYMLDELGGERETANLGVTTYLLGLAVGSVLFSPLSEIWGRHPVYIASLIVFTTTIIPCALGTSLGEILVLRFFCALSGAVMLSNGPSTVSDVVDEEHRPLAFSFWAIAPINAPVIGPLVGGFLTRSLGWRWTNWLAVICGGISLVMMSCIRETYPPSILRNKAAQRRKQTGDPRWWSRYDENLDIIDMLRTGISRPFIMTFTEPVLFIWSFYMGTTYGIYYLFFVAYPIVFTKDRGWPADVSGIAFMGICVGILCAIAMEPLLRRCTNRQKKDPVTGRPFPEASVFAVCIASILMPLGILWFAWTCVPASIHWVWSLLAGIPYGCGNTLVMIYMQNHIAGCYGIYTASAFAGNTFVRSVVGGILPLAGTPLYDNLGPNWAGTILGLLEIVLIPIPFAIYKWGGKLRAKSSLIQEMQADKLRNSRVSESQENQILPLTDNYCHP